VTWLDQRQLLFSRIRSGMHLGIVTGTQEQENYRELYFPAHERGMAHYSYASPDRHWALVVEMDGKGDWAACRLISMNGESQPKAIGPDGACTSAGWSPDGAWMYFTAAVAGQSHLWRQRFPNGRPEQITFGPTEEDGVAVERNGHSIITSVGVHESSIWLHDEHGERSMSSEGEVITDKAGPAFSPDSKTLYYLLRRRTAGAGAELWRMNVATGASEGLFPGVFMTDYEVSPDGKQVVYSTARTDKPSRLWIAPINRESPARQIGDSGESSPHFGRNGKILFTVAEGSFNYLEQMNPDGSERAKVFDYPINQVQVISPGRRWVVAALSRKDGKGVEEMAIPTDGGPMRLICANFCWPALSPNGSFLFIPIEGQSRETPGRSLAIPIGPGDTLPDFPPNGIEPGSGASAIPGTQVVERAELVPGNDPSHFAYVNTTVHRNLYRVSLP
jgi:hypothetical protein